MIRFCFLVFLFSRNFFYQRKRIFSVRSERRSCPVQITVSDTASYALPAGVRARCASETGKRSSNAVSELPSLQDIHIV